MSNLATNSVNSMIDEMVIIDLKKEHPIEALRLVYLIDEYQNVKKSRQASPNSRNIVDTCKRNIPEPAIGNYFRCAEKQGLVVQSGYYLDKPTFKLTEKGMRVAEALRNCGFYV